jgi:two-component sensor histidine kinase
MPAFAPSGLSAVPQLRWGSHMTQFFGDGAELRDLLVPYFKAGLENNECCFWVTGAAFTANDARSALRAAVPDLDIRERNRQIEITDAEEWYAPGTKLQPPAIMADLLRRAQSALDSGHEGLRTNGNCAWVTAAQWADFQAYESLVQSAVPGRRMICMCSYCMDQLQDNTPFDVMARHDIVLPSIVLPSANRMADTGHRQPHETRHVILAQEMQHRVNNTLTTVLAIMNATFRQSPTMDGFRQSFAGRIAALSKTHAVLTQSEQSSLPFAQLLENELGMFMDGDASRIQLSGADFTLSERVAVPVSMAIHELATNAAKYGALSPNGGKLSISWKLSQDVAHLHWREADVPMPTARTRTGFGTRLLKDILPKQIGGKFAIDYLPDGVQVTFSFPVI